LRVELSAMEKLILHIRGLEGVSLSLDARIHEVVFLKTEAQTKNRMTQTIIRRIGSTALLLILTILFVASTPNESSARKRSVGHGRKVSHSAQHRHGGKRFARLSKKHHAKQIPLTSQEKAEIVQRIKNLASSKLITDEPSAAGVSLSADGSTVVASEASNLDIQKDIAQAADEERREDNVDVSIEQFFQARPGAVDGSSLDPQLVKSRQEDYTLFDQLDSKTAAHRSDVMAQIIDWLGTRYEFGGEARSGVDCSAFTRAVFAKAFGVTLPRTAFAQHSLGETVDRDELRFGDLVFFHTAHYSPVSHVGIYIGEGLFANAACSRGVSVASMQSPYWSKHYIGAKRLFSNNEVTASVKDQLKQMAAAGELTSADTTPAENTSN
jgi:cell wall-associated NlpC family hydrolase